MRYAAQLLLAPRAPIGPAAVCTGDLADEPLATGIRLSAGSTGERPTEVERRR
jgi:hypothetical protein